MMEGQCPNEAPRRNRKKVGVRGVLSKVDILVRTAGACIRSTTD